MNIVAVSARIPMVDAKGDQIVSFYRLQYLAKSGHNISLVCYGDERCALDLDAKIKLESIGIDVSFVEYSKFSAVLNIICNLRSGVPLQCLMLATSEFRRKFNFIVGNVKPDFIYSVMIRVGENIKHFDGRVVFELVDSMGLNFYRRADNSAGLKKIVFQKEAELALQYERVVADKSLCSFVVSNHDKNFIGSKNITAIPLGVDVDVDEEKYKEAIAAGLWGPVVVFTGNMNYQPNIDAVSWFIKHCWNLVKSKVPNVRLVIAGNNPSKEITQYGVIDDKIEVTGRVPSIRVVLRKSTVSIAPMMSGSGMQFKILEAMACGLPVVTNKLGLGDIGAKAGCEILVCEKPVDFVDAIGSLISNPSLAREVGAAGQDYVLRNHSWDVCNDKFLDSLLSGFGN